MDPELLTVGLISIGGTAVAALVLFLFARSRRSET